MTEGQVVFNTEITAQSQNTWITCLRSTHRQALYADRKVISFIEDHKVIDKIINRLNLTFKTEKPPPPKTQLNMAAEE